MDLKLVYMINPPSLIPSWSFCFLLSKKILKCSGVLDNMLSQFPTYWFAWCFKYIFAVISVESWVYVHSIISNGRFLKGPWALAEVRQSRLGSREERLEFVVLRRELMSLMKGQLPGSLSHTSEAIFPGWSTPLYVPSILLWIHPKCTLSGE